MGNFRVIISGSLLQLLTLAIFPFSVPAQSSEESKNIFKQAESYFLYEEYELANQLYLLLETPDNLYIKYKIGTCYLNIPGEKGKSIPYLEEAVKNASYDTRSDSYKEKRAPLDAYFYLGKAYLVNNDLEKAVTTFETFRKLARETTAKGGMKNLEFVDQQLQACQNAIKLKEKPVIFSKTMLGTNFSQGAINENPAVSFDGNTIVYTERRGAINAIFISRKENEIWQPPADITEAIGAGEDCYSCSLNRDGTELFVYKTDNYDGVIYSSVYQNGTWSRVSKLNKNINTKFYESHAAVSADGRKLYFTSNREGGLGNLDIYVSEKDAANDWGPAVNLGPSINTPFNEDTPFITENDSVLYFSSEGHSSMGGYDIFKSQRSGTSWAAPSNVGYPVNSTDDDKFFQPFNNGQNAFYALTTDYKKREIFYLSLSGPVISRDTPTYVKINLDEIPAVAAVDTSIIIKNLNVTDLADKNIKDSDILYYTVQVMALLKPVDMNYFKFIPDIKLMYNDQDKFYRYTTGIFKTREEAFALRLELIKKGYPEEIFIKKVSK